MKCPALETLYRKDWAVVSGKQVIESVPSSLRRLKWDAEKGLVQDVTLPEDCFLTHFQEKVFKNNIRRHQTLVGLHPDWFHLYWPLNSPDVEKLLESVEDGNSDSEDDE